MNPKRTKSFWIENLGFLDKMLFKMRVKRVLKGMDLDDKTILDTWCGYNAMTLQYIQKKYKPKKLIAMDLKLNISHLRDVSIEAIEWNLNEEWKLKEECDVILSTAILEHLENPDDYLKYVYKNLKKGGKLLMTIPSVYAKPVLEFMAYKLKIINKEEILDHKDYYNKKKLLWKLQQVGFKKEKIKHSYFQLFMNNYIKAIKW